MAWKRGVKSLYYCRSLSIQRADNGEREGVVRPDRLSLGMPANDDDASPLPMVAAGSHNRLRGVPFLPVEK